MDINTITIVGRLARNPEKQNINSKHIKVLLTVAVSRPNDDGTDFITVETWRRTAENCLKYLSKGDYVAAVNGRLKIRSWQDNDGKWREKSAIVRAKIEFGPKAKRDRQNSLDHDDIPY